LISAVGILHDVHWQHTKDAVHLRNICRMLSVLMTVVMPSRLAWKKRNINKINSSSSSSSRGGSSGRAIGHEPTIVLQGETRQMNVHKTLIAQNHQDEVAV
jgi:hypothetical protein